MRPFSPRQLFPPSESDTVDETTMSEQLLEEVEALDAIHPGAFVHDGSLFKLEIPDTEIKLQISFPRSYPDESPSILSANRLEDVLKDVLDRVFVPGQVCIFDFLEAVREIFESQPDLEVSEEVAATDEPVEDIFEGWIASEEVIDRKSAFIGRAAYIKSPEEAIAKISKLKLDKRIARATHNMTAYRIESSIGMQQDCDDDGETAAGGRLLHLLQLTDSVNVVVCVSRWYGGIQLGPDRFKRINSCARDALVKGGFIDESKKKKK